MNEQEVISEEAKEILHEIVDHEFDFGYWEKRIDALLESEREIIRGCFKELLRHRFVSALWVYGIPQDVHPTSEGYAYEKLLDEQITEIPFYGTPFEKGLNRLLDRAKNIKPPINAAPVGTDINEYNQPSEEWVNDAEILYNSHLKDHPLANRIETILLHRQLSTYNDLLSVFKSISHDTDYLNKKRAEQQSTSGSPRKGVHMKEYDVFLSHANKDKVDFVDELHKALETLGVNIFYDKFSIEWGDEWKQRILKGTEKSEFAIIVISENFFGREWTERELTEFLARQNTEGQKIILPILHNISHTQLQEKYPAVADIQTIDSTSYTCEQIALLFARQLIKRLKS